MSTAVKIGLASLLLAAPVVVAQEAPPAFKLGTFERQGRTFVGIVLRESTVIDFAAAHAALRDSRLERRGAARHEGRHRALRQRTAGTHPRDRPLGRDRRRRRAAGVRATTWAR